MTVTVDPRIGTELAGYRIEALLGRGGMGVVYLAEQLRLKRRVALKLLAPDLAADGRFRERFLRESELAASISTASDVCSIFDAGEADGLLYIAMRYVEGTDLGSLLSRRGGARQTRGQWTSSAPWPPRSIPRMRAASPTATSSPATCCWPRTAMSTWPTSASPGPEVTAVRRAGAQPLLRSSVRLRRPRADP